MNYEEKNIERANNILKKLKLGYLKTIDYENCLERVLPFWIIYLYFKDGFNFEELLNRGLTFKDINFINATVEGIRNLDKLIKEI